MVENHHRGEGEIYSIQLLELVFLSGKREARTIILFCMSWLCCIKVFLVLLNLEPKAEMDPEKIPGGMRPVSESLYSDGRINVCVRTQETTSRHLCNLFSMHPKYCHGNGRCKHTHTHAIINKGPLWIFSGMSGEALGHTTASKHGSDRVEEHGSADTC